MFFWLTVGKKLQFLFAQYSDLVVYARYRALHEPAPNLGNLRYLKSKTSDIARFLGPSVYTVKKG